MNQIYLNEVLKQFDIYLNAESYGNGHINDTYCVDGPQYILQRINTSIFRNPDELMSNIENVTSFLRKKIIAAGGNPDRETLTVIRTKDGENYYKVDDQNVFRVYKFISHTFLSSRIGLMLIIFEIKFSVWCESLHFRTMLNK